jgi:hypothetical protein
MRASSGECVGATRIICCLSAARATAASIVAALFRVQRSEHRLWNTLRARQRRTPHCAKVSPLITSFIEAMAQDCSGCGRKSRCAGGGLSIVFGQIISDDGAGVHVAPKCARDIAWSVVVASGFRSSGRKADTTIAAALARSLQPVAPCQP